MIEPAPNAELLRSLGRLVRGLSALFWGLPVALIVCVQTAKTDMLRPFNIVPPLVVTGWLCFGLWQLGYFQKQERIWQSALDRAKILAFINLGLSPFLFWWSQLPSEMFFTRAMVVMAVCSLLLLDNLNIVIFRLSAMLPDEGLRQEARHFTTLNRYLVLGILVVGALLVGAILYPTRVPPVIAEFLYRFNPGGLWLLIFMLLMPLAMTMALLWKIKETILESVFGGGR